MILNNRNSNNNNDFISTSDKYKQSLLNKLEENKETENLEDFKVYIYHEEDEFAKYDISKVIDMTPKVRTTDALSRLSPLGLFREKEIIKIVLYGELRPVDLEKIEDYIKDGREFIFEVKNEDDISKIEKRVSKLDTNFRNKIKVFTIKEFQDKLEWCETKVRLWSKNKLNKEIITSLKYYMFKNFDKWNEVELMFDIESEVNKEVLDTYFSDLEHYNIDSFLDSVILGNKKRKSIEVLNYLIEKKGYKPYFILDLLKRRLEYYLELILYRDKGVYVNNEITMNTLTKRAEFLGFKVSNYIESDDKKRSILMENLTILKDEEVIEAYEKVINLYKSRNKYTIKEKEIIILIKEIINERSKERVDEINKRIFLLMKSKRKSSKQLKK